MIGNYDMSKMRDPSNLIWVDLTRSITPYWQSSIGNIRIGNEEYRLSVDYTAIFDSGTSQIILPYSIADKVIGKVLQGKRFSQMTPLTKVVTCDLTKYEPL